MTRFVIHNHLPKSAARDAGHMTHVNRKYSIPYEENGKWYYASSESGSGKGTTHGPYKSKEDAAASIRSQNSSRDRVVRDGGREVPREQEEKNRDKMYRDTGIKRVKRD